MRPQAESVASEAETLERLLAQRSRQLTGVIRVTTPEIIANMMLTPWLAEFMELYPDIKVEVIATDEKLSLTRGEADVALRAGHMPKESGIVVRRLAEKGLAVLLVSHNMNDVFEVADRVAVLRLGHMVAEKPAPELDTQIVVDYMTTGTSSRAPDRSSEG